MGTLEKSVRLGWKAAEKAASNGIDVSVTFELLPFPSARE
jgi:hypothetical protein